MTVYFGHNLGYLEVYYFKINLIFNNNPPKTINYWLLGHCLGYIGANSCRMRVLCHFCEKNSTDFGYFYGKFRNYSKITGVLKSKCRDTLPLEFFTCEIVNLTKFDKNVQILTKWWQNSYILSGFCQEMSIICKI